MESSERAKWQMMQHCWESGQWERMEALGRDLLATMPSDADVLNAVGVAVFQLGRREEAAALFREALVNEPDHAPSHAMMGWYWARRKRFGQAEGCLQTAISIDPTADDFWVDLGQVMLVQGNHRGAKTCAAKALALNAGNAGAVALDAEAERASDGIGRASPSQRRVRIESALAMEPDNPALHEALGEVYQEEGRLREAEERFRESLALDPSRPWLWGKVRRMGLKRDRIDRLLSAPWRFGLWLLSERHFGPLALGLLVCGVWAAVVGPVSFLYRAMFRIELELLAARGTRSASISPGRRAVRLGLLAIAAALYWWLVWWLARLDVTWLVAKWAMFSLIFVLIGAGIFYSVREVRSDMRHRRALRKLEEGWSSEE